MFKTKVWTLINTLHLPCTVSYRFLYFFSVPTKINSQPVDMIPFCRQKQNLTFVYDVLSIRWTPEAVMTGSLSSPTFKEKLKKKQKALKRKKKAKTYLFWKGYEKRQKKKHHSLRAFFEWFLHFSSLEIS